MKVWIIFAVICQLELLKVPVSNNAESIEKANKDKLHMMQKQYSAKHSLELNRRHAYIYIV